MKTVLVTGATGNVGHRIATRLRDRGDRVRALVRDPNRARKVLPDVELVRGDVTAPETLAPAMRDVGLVFQWQRDEDIFDRLHVDDGRRRRSARGNARRDEPRRSTEALRVREFEGRRGSRVR